LLADISDLQSVQQMHSLSKPIQSAVAHTSTQEVVVRDTDAVPGNTPVRHRSFQLTDWLFLERYVSIVWTRRRVRDKRINVKLVLGPLVSSAKRGGESTDTTSSLRHAVCRIALEESNSNFQLPRFKSCAAPLNYASSRQRVGEWLFRVAFQLVAQNNGL
jgi:hypothetical protein